MGKFNTRSYQWTSPPPAVAFTAFADVWPRATQTETGAVLCAMGVGRTSTFFDILYQSLPLPTRPSEVVRVRTCYGKLWKLIMPFSRTWKVLEREVFRSNYGKVLEFLCLGTF